jgi:two-component system phosphate regulon sensor histidine kinase PhoR
MFRRLAAVFSLLVALVLLALAVGTVAIVSAAEERLFLLVLLCAVGAVALVAVVLVSLALSRAIGRTLRDLSDAIEQMGAGSGNSRVFSTDKEWGRLGQTFNRASERLSMHIAQLEQDRQQLRAILSGMVEGVVALDADQRILFANERASDLLELPAPAPVGRPLWEVIRQRSLLDSVRRALASPEPHREEINWTGKSARSLTVHAARLPGGPFSAGAVLVLHDTSELRRLERLRQDFVANVSHELKTPLSVIKAHIETLVDGAVEDAANRDRFLNQIGRQADRLHALILDLLSLARIESGSEMFDFQAVGLEGLIQACVERHRPRAEARRQTLLVTPEAPTLAVWADEEALDQILENLLDNALKYTPEGGQVRVGWRIDDGQAAIEVADTGIGIPEADLPRIFERFYRVDKARSREMGGTGLGLSIVKHLAQAMYGSVRATSRVGAGTTFVVCVPLAEVAPRAR